MNEFQYLSMLERAPDAQYEVLSEGKAHSMNLPTHVFYTFHDGTKGGTSITNKGLANFTNGYMASAIKYSMVVKKRIEVCSTYRLPASERRALEQVGASIFTMHSPQNLTPSEVVRVDLKDSVGAQRRKVLEAVALL